MIEIRRSPDVQARPSRFRSSYHGLLSLPAYRLQHISPTPSGIAAAVATVICITRISKAVIPLTPSQRRQPSGETPAAAHTAPTHKTIPGHTTEIAASDSATCRTTAVARPTRSCRHGCSCHHGTDQCCCHHDTQSFFLHKCRFPPLPDSQSRSRYISFTFLLQSHGNIRQTEMPSEITGYPSIVFQSNSGKKLILRQ